MKGGLVIIPWGLLVVLLTAGTAFASGAACPRPLTTPPRLFLQTDHLKIPGLNEPSDHPAGQQGYQLDTSLIGIADTAGIAKTDNAPVALTAEKDLAALRLRTDGPINPYIGAGVTAVPEAAETPGLSDFEAEREADLQAYQLGAGFACDLSHSARLNLGYRYSAGNLSELAGIKPNTAEPEESKHHLSFGLKLDF